MNRSSGRHIAQLRQRCLIASQHSRQHLLLLERQMCPLLLPDVIKAPLLAASTTSSTTARTTSPATALATRGLPL
jgi:hypothetical protein